MNELVDVGEAIAPSPTPYLLNHSVGRPLRAVADHLADDVITQWRDTGTEPWDAWLPVIERFCDAIGRLLGADAADVCPQVGVSGGLAKFLPSHARLRRDGARVVMAEVDFPSIGFAVRHALPEAALRFIPATADVTDAGVWADHVGTGVDLVVVTHAWSNTGRQAPVAELVTLAREVGSMVVVDAAQSAGVLPIDLGTLAPDAVFGSCVKWLSGGPGAGWVWIDRAVADECTPRDVGWFSHEEPFAFDIHDFRPAAGARRFWGGTPSVLPYAVAARAVDFFVEVGIERVRGHNLALLGRLHDALGNLLVSPSEHDRCSGTAVLDAGAATDAVEAALADAAIAVDRRSAGIRISPHVGNDRDDVDALVDVVGGVLGSSD